MGRRGNVVQNEVVQKGLERECCPKVIGIRLSKRDWNKLSKRIGIRRLDKKAWNKKVVQKWLECCAKGLKGGPEWAV